MVLLQVWRNIQRYLSATLLKNNHHSFFSSLIFMLWISYSACNIIYFMQEQDIYGILFSIGKNHGSFSANIAKHLAKEVFSISNFQLYLHACHLRIMLLVVPFSILQFAMSFSNHCLVRCTNICVWYLHFPPSYLLHSFLRSVF